MSKQQVAVPLMQAPFVVITAQLTLASEQLTYRFAESLRTALLTGEKEGCLILLGGAFGRFRIGVFLNGSSCLIKSEGAEALKAGNSNPPQY